MRLRAAVLLFPALLLAGCDRSASEAVPQAPPSPTDETTAAAAPIPASDLLIVERSPTLNFHWRVPAEVAQHPALLATMRTDALQAQEKMRTTAREEAQFRAENGARPVAISMDESWALSWENAALLNLTVAQNSYRGGAHPNLVYKSILWDKTAARAIALPDLFSDWPNIEAGLSAQYCEALDAERAKRRGADVDSDGPFGKCPPLTEQPVALMGNAYDGFYGIEVLLGPYVAGAYAEGSYRIELPFDEAMRAAMKADYLPVR
ncbi:MAG: hypothetical protein WA979_11805 [Pacificimonas sp.]